MWRPLRSLSRARRGVGRSKKSGRRVEGRHRGSRTSAHPNAGLISDSATCIRAKAVHGWIGQSVCVRPDPTLGQCMGRPGERRARLLDLRAYRRQPAVPFPGAGEVWRGCLNQPEALFSSAEGARPSGRRCVAPRPRWGALEAALSQGWRGRLGVDSARELRSRCPALTCPAHSPTHAPRASLPVQP